MTFTHIKVDASVGAVGAEVTGVDLSQPLHQEIVGEIHTAWLEHHILFFRDQDLSPQAQANFAANFGETRQVPIYAGCGCQPTCNSHH